MSHLSFEISVNQENYEISAKVTVIGQDLLIVITGGDHPHIGDVTTLTRNDEPQTVRFPSHDGRFHKDDFVSNRIAKAIQANLPGSCTITAGIHVDGITKAQIAAAGSMADQLGNQLNDWLKTQSFGQNTPKYYDKNEAPK
ncbi:hypothetical protein FD44_GL001444 [Secundilactobacillus malefermentans DSM 5705 = KCTC 3548]|nr:hypothetical protein FD44_GL001444 [Secundilactobacillus malefermentans DSM 5705 = KCTC 3548]